MSFYTPLYNRALITPPSKNSIPLLKSRLESQTPALRRPVDRAAAADGRCVGV